MDEITLVRELGSETGMPSPQRLSTARDRLTAEISPVRRSRRWPLLMAAAAAAAVAAVTVPSALAPTAAPDPAITPSQAPALTPVAAFLDEAAIVAETGPDLAPRDDQFFYIRVIEWDGTPNEAWLSIDGKHDGRGRDQDGNVATIPGCRSTDCEVVEHYRADMPTEPEAMIAWIRKYTASVSGSDNLDAITKHIGVLQTRYWMRPAQRSAFYRAIGRIEGIRLVEGVKDSRGREGVAVGWVSPASGDEHVLWIFDPKTHVLLGTGESSIDSLALVDKVGQKG